MKYKTFDTKNCVFHQQWQIQEGCSSAPPLLRTQNCPYFVRKKKSEKFYALIKIAEKIMEIKENQNS